MDAESPQAAGARDAATVARAGSVAFVGLVGSRGVRTLVTWVLSAGLGPAGFGVYTLATTVVSLLGLVAPLGLVHGVTLFGARHRAAGERDQLKGVLLGALGLSAAAGVVLSAVVALGAPLGARWFEEPSVESLLVLAAPSVFLLGWLGVLAGALRAGKDVPGEVMVVEGVIPAILFVGSAAAVLLGTGPAGAVEAFVVANALGVVLAWRRLYRSFSDVIGDPGVRPRFEWAPILRFSLPQTLVDVLHKAVLWTDLLVLGVLATTADVGRYRVAVALAVAGVLPAAAVTRIFNPLAAEMIHGGQLDRLQDLLRAVTRWLAIAVLPLYIVLLVAPDLVLWLFGPEYLDTAGAVGILLVGQLLFVLCTPTNSAIQMAGHAMPNLVNGVVALVLNIALNVWLIPRYGYVGAAAASAMAFTAWSVLRVAEAWWLLRVFPFDLRSVLLPVTVLGGAFALHDATQGWSVPARLGAVLGALVAFSALAWTAGASPADRALARSALKRTQPDQR